MARPLLKSLQAKLKRLRKRVREELEMWQREIREREEWQKQRNKFETFLKKQVRCGSIYKTNGVHHCLRAWFCSG